VDELDTIYHIYAIQNPKMSPEFRKVVAPSLGFYEKCD
jgi:hypothetical protein